jgi:hypothetical protein
VHAALVAARNAFDNVVRTAPAPSQPIPDDTHTFDGTATQALGVALLLGLGLGLMVDS